MESMNPTHHFESVKRYIENKETESLLECLDTLAPHAIPIGEGKNAEVLSIDEGKFSSVCMKKFHEHPELKCNDLDMEVDFQNRVRDLGVRTPMTFVHVEDTETGELFVLMERIFGITINDIVNGDHQVPDNFNHKQFFQKLSDYVALMHENNIHHRDLHEKNVMIDEHGDPVIIDFGTACSCFSGDEFPYKERVLVFNKTTGRYEMKDGYFRDDKRMLYQLELSMRKFSQNKGVY